MMAEDNQALRRSRLRASFGTQTNALLRKNVAFQKRKWGANLCLILAPFLICVMLYVLQDVINHQLDSRSFRCGCKCLSCCDWVPVRGLDGTVEYLEECYNATDSKPCSPYASCSSYNDTECGYLYSTADQVGFCEVKQPPIWPALVQLPREKYRDAKYPNVQSEYIPNQQLSPNEAGMLYTADNLDFADGIMKAFWDRPLPIAQSVSQAYYKAQSGGRDIPSSTANQTISSEASFVDAARSLTEGLYEFGLVMGTSAFTSVTLLMEPAFVATTSGSEAGAASRPPLYFALGNCNNLTPADVNALQQVGEAITNMTGFPVRCASVPPAKQLNRQEMTDQVFCGWKSSSCVYRNGTKLYLTQAEKVTGSENIIQEYVPLYDWHNTSDSGVNFTVWMNNTNVARDPGIPDIQRWNQPINLATNAYLKYVLGPNVSARLGGVRDMPKGQTQLALDFSTLLGPLFMMWFFLLMLPINVYTLVHEREKHLRTMMKMQGLSDSVYYFTQYMWMLGLYCIFLCVFVLFGSLINLKIFTLNDYSLQFAFYFLWGNVLASYSFYFACWQREARTAVLLAVIYVIIAGFVANLVLIQFIEKGPTRMAYLMELDPAFGLFRGLYELAQYGFLAGRNNGEGLTWSKLTEPKNGMARIWVYFLIEIVAFPLIAYYREQITGGATGVRKHWLFFLGYRSTPFQETKRKRWWQRQKKDDSATAKQTDNNQLKVENGKKPSSGPTEIEANSTAENSLVSPTEYYYGSFNGAPESAQLDGVLESLGSNLSSKTLNQETAAILDKGIDTSHLVASKQTNISRKVTSVKLSVAGGGVLSHEENSDVAAERKRVDSMWSEWSGRPETLPPSAIILHQLKKVYPVKDGNAAKVAVHDLSLAIERRECFGLLGPNGAGKTTTIRMMEGFLEPSSGEAIIEGYSIQNDMDTVYCLMGACPQHDLLWEGLTGREHLLFYGRLKNLQGGALKKAVIEGLRSVNLEGFGDELVSGYSGGMKRRLSVAIALMGDPLVVYLDEPSTGLDPSSRRLLWEVIKKARRDKALVLTTHSMEEAEALCDRLGIFVNGRLQCIGNPKDLTARFGGYLSFTITTPPEQEMAALAVVRCLSPGAKLVYALGGTQKFELPITEVEVADLFKRMEEVKLKEELTLLDWGVSNATLEEVFIKITHAAGVQLQAFT